MHYAYRVVELRERMIGGKQSGQELEKVLNEHGAKGWRCISIVKADVKGHIGPGGMEGLLVTFESPIPQTGAAPDAAT